MQNLKAGLNIDQSSVCFVESTPPVSTPAIPARRMKRRTKAVLSVVLLALILTAAVFGSYFVIGSLAPAPRACAQGETPVGFGAGEGSCVSFAVTINHQEQRFVNLGLVAAGFSASCWAFCSNGITYTLDPAPIITNVGHDFEQCKVFGSAGTITCTAADVVSVIGLSESATAPAAGDTSASGPCKTTAVANEIESGGLTDVASTVTPGAAGSTVTTTIRNTFTAAESDASVQVACLQTELHTGANVIIYAEGTFGPDSLVSGNTLTITWTISRT